MFSKPLGKLLLGIGLLIALSGCVQVFENEKKEEQPKTSQVTQTALTGEPVVIGALLELSGEGSAYGLPAQRVFEIALKDINNAGGVNGRPLKLEYEDGGCEATLANKAINNLVNLKKVKVVVGALCSSEVLTAAPVVEQNKVVLLSTGASSPKITEAGDFIFRNYPSDKSQGEVLAEYAKAKGYKKVGMVVEEQPYTEGIADTFSAIFKQLGKGTTVVEKFAKDASDFRTQITKLQAAKVDVFFVDTQAPAKADILVKQLKEAGVKGPLILNDVAISSNKEVVEKYKDYLEGSVGAEVPYDKNHPYLPKLKEAYKALADGKEIPYLSYMSPTYDALFIIREAVEKVGEDPVKIKDYLYTVKGRKGLAGTLSFDKNGDPTAEYRHSLRVVKAGAVEDLAMPEKK